MTIVDDLAPNVASLDDTGAGCRSGAVFVTHPLFRTPAFGTMHPLSIMRQSAVLDLCEALGWLDPGLVREAPLPSKEVLGRFHDAAYLDALEASSNAMHATRDVRERYNIGSMECPLFEGLWDRARASVGGSILAAELALEGKLAFHPGGGTHHGRANRASGFCYLNDPVFAILRLLDAGLKSVVYVDLDAHHGDGVEAAFAFDRRVTLVSIHEEGRWPGTGAVGDRGGGQAYNIPVPRHINDDEFLFIVGEIHRRLLAPLKPDGVVITCGADGLKGDPLSAMELSNTALWSAVSRCASLAPHAVVLGGGGYNPWTTARAWAGLWARLSGQPIPEALPVAAKDVLRGLACDLVDDEDRDPRWLTTIADDPNTGPIRARCREILDEVLVPVAGDQPD